MEVLINKSPIPIIWLDTSAVIRLTKYRVKEYLPELEYKRYSELYQLIYKKVRERKLLCPKADQLEEIELGNRLVEECEKTNTLLSLGIRFVHRGQIESTQRQQFMKSYIEEKTKIQLDFRDIFFKDPIEEINNRSPFIISAWGPTSTEQIDKNKSNKRITIEKIEELRQTLIAQGVSYEEQLKEEYKGIIHAYISVLEEWRNIFASKKEPTIDEFFRFQLISEPLLEWERYHGIPRGYEGLLQYYLSDVYRKIPNIDISCRLMSGLVTSETPIKSGDIMDVDQLSSIIPYVDYVITDKIMRNKVIQLEIDQEYNTKVWCMRDFDSIIEELGNL